MAAATVPWATPLRAQHIKCALKRAVMMLMIHDHHARPRNLGQWGDLICAQRRERIHCLPQGLRTQCSPQRVKNQCFPQAVRIHYATEIKDSLCISLSEESKFMKNHVHLKSEDSLCSSGNEASLFASGIGNSMFTTKIEDSLCNSVIADSKFASISEDSMVASSNEGSTCFSVWKYNIYYREEGWCLSMVVAVGVVSKPLDRPDPASRAPGV